MTPRNWANEAVRRVEADADRSADTHLHTFPLSAEWGIDLYLKDESVHPTGSLKHRLARSLFLYGLCNGWITERTTVVDASTGSTAVSEAYFARFLGLPFVAVMPASTSPEKIALIEAEGASCHLVEDPSMVVAEAQRLAAERDGHFLDQFTYAERAMDWRGNNNVAESIFSRWSSRNIPSPPGSSSGREPADERDDRPLHAPDAPPDTAGVTRPRTVQEDQVLWRQGDDAGEMVFVVDGAVSASLQLPGDRTVEIGRAGPGEAVGEIGLLDGDGHTMSARVTKTATLLTLGRLDFAALLAGQDPAAFRLKRRLASLFAARLRNQRRHLVTSLGGDVAGPPAEDAPPASAELEECPPPDSKYVRQMANFHDFDPLALWGFLTSGRYVRCPPGQTLLAEGAPSSAYYLTINGAVQKVLIRHDWRIRVGLAGPGKAFGYESLIDGQPSPFTAITRERALLLVVPRDLFGKLFNGEDDVSRAFHDVIQRDLTATLRETLRPCARLAASV